VSYYEFSENGRECIVKCDTPLPWMNLLNNDVFQTWVTHTGNIECFMLNRSINGLTNPQEKSGYVYLRDHSTGRYFMLNKPKEGVSWQAKHGLGYTTVAASSLGLKGTVTYFVPRDDNVLIWLITIRNKLSVERKIDVFSTVEWSLGDSFKVMVFRGHGGGGDAFTGGSQLNLYKKIYFEDGILYGIQSRWRMSHKPWPYTGFFSSSLPVRSFETVKSIFIGRGRTLENPIAVEKGACTNALIWGTNEFPWGVLHNSIKLVPKGEEKLAIILGMVRNKSDAPKIVKKYSNIQIAESELQRVKAFWKKFVEETVHVETPEKEIDRTVNIWAKYQWRTAMMRNLNTGLRGQGLWTYTLGFPFGFPFPEAVTQPHDLEIVKEIIIDFLQRQDNTGRLALWSQPFMLYNNLDMKWPPEKVVRPPYPLPHHHEISQIYPVCYYIKETGDLSFLDKKIPYFGGGKGTVFEHLCKGVDYSLSGLSERGLPRLNPGGSDYNDELTLVSREGKAESVMLAEQLCYILKECADVAKAYGRLEETEDWMKKYEYIKSAVNKYAWDGEWYIRLFADGEEELIPIGSSKNEEGKIWLNAQSWAVISGVAEGERAQICMESVEKYLMSEYGPIIVAPSYSKLDRHVGAYGAPGWRTGCIYLRPVGWAVMAECLADRANQAFEMYKRASLSNVCKDVDRFQLEPYVYPENYVGPEHRMFGQGQFQWCLGEGANWMWHSYVYYILGVRPVLDGLLVDPKIPNDWEGFRMMRHFRGATYKIEVANPDRLNKGVKSMNVDGKTIEGNVLPAFKDGKTHTVKITLES